MSENTPDPSPDQCSDDCSQTAAITESVTGTTKSSKDEFTKDGLSGQNNFTNQTNLNEIQASQEQEAASVHSPTEPGKFPVTDSNSETNEDTSHFPVTSNSLNRKEAMEQEATKKPETSRGESETVRTNVFRIGIYAVKIDLLLKVYRYE